MAGYTVQNIKSNEQGLMDPAALAKLLDHDGEDVAALMVTNSKHAWRHL